MQLGLQCSVWSKILVQNGMGKACGWVYWKAGNYDGSTSITLDARKDKDKLET